MTMITGNNFLLIFAAIFTGILSANALQYDHTATVECLPKPHKPQYNGGIIRNPELDRGLESWSTFGSSKIEHRRAKGNAFVVACDRNRSYDSVSQKIYLHEDMLYTFSAWVQVTDGEIPIRAVLKTRTGFRHIGTTVAKPGCWSMIKGGITADASGPAELYFESENTSVEIWIDSISLQPFTWEEWTSHQQQNVRKKHKRTVEIRVVDKRSKPIANATVSIVQNKLGFPFGCAINTNILHNPAYQKWFTARFGVTVFENEMKWYSTEYTRGREDYSAADALLAFTEDNSIQVRGHNVFWDDPQYQLGWVSSLPPSQLSQAALRRQLSVMRRYKGKVIGWDVVNENLHFSFFENKLGGDASAKFYKVANRIDPSTTMFLNEYNTIEDSRDPKSSPSAYLAKIRQIQAAGGRNLGIGLESHFNTPDIAYMRSTIDSLAATGLPIWITELDVQRGPNQARYLEQILREAHAHPKINGIVLWSGWRPEGCYRMCLTDNNFNNLPTGDVVDKLMKEWGGMAAATTTGRTDSEGMLEVSLFHGDYEVSIGGRNGSSASYVGVHSIRADDSGEKSQLRLVV